ncbi:MAG: glycoside hydrolase domain-containing protein [Planctomycetota bacterium]
MDKTACVAVFGIILGSAGFWPGGVHAESAGEGQAILGNSTQWRVRVVRETEEVRMPSGDVGHYTWDFKVRNLEKQCFRELPEGVHTVPADKIAFKKVEMRRIPMETSADWMKADFDDGEWARTTAPLLHEAKWVDWKLILLRSRFQVETPSDLKLSMMYKGGVRVYLNGEELTAKDLIEGSKGLYAGASPDRPESYTDEKMKGLRYVQYNTPPEVVKYRTRTLENFTVPAAKLKKGFNVLAVSIHRSVAPWEFYATRLVNGNLTAYDDRAHALWSRAALHNISLAGAGAAPNVSAPRFSGLKVWNQTALTKVRVGDYPSPGEDVRAIRFSAVRNGTFAGLVVLGGGTAFKDLKSAPTDLKGPGVIPASAVRVRYGLPDGPLSHKAPKSDQPFDSLDDVPPSEVSIREGGTCAVQPLWVTVSVPADAKAGTYQGSVNVSSSVGAVTVPLEVTVADWTLPGHRDFIAYTDIFQSPETLAIGYNVPMWSEEHWKLIEKSFALMGPMAAKNVYLTCIRKTHLGNEHAMVRWKKGAGGKWAPDFSIAEKYLDLAVKHMGKSGVVVLYAWEPPDSMGHGNTFTPGPEKIHDRDVLITVVGPDGKLTEDVGPKWDSPECVEFWKALTGEAYKVLEARGIPKSSLIFGLMGDHRPTETAMKNVAAAAPGLEWGIHAHHYCDKWYGVELGLCSAVWGIKCILEDPDKAHGYGWQNSFRLFSYPRGELSAGSTLVNYRTVNETWLGSVAYNAGIWPKAKGARGLGRQGADFWPVLKNEPEKRDANWHYGNGGRLSGRYPETYWGQLCINYGNPAFFGMGRNGAIPTFRSEMIRENAQEVEARVFIEKTLLDEAKKAKLGDELSRRCREALDERIRYCIYGNGEGELWFLSTGVQDRMEKLFALAAEVAGRIGAK